MQTSELHLVAATMRVEAAELRKAARKMASSGYSAADVARFEGRADGLDSAADRLDAVIGPR